MISIGQLKGSIYKESYFSECTGTLTVNNEDKETHGVLSYVEMHSNGKFISLDNKILKGGADIYQKEDRERGRISYRRDCDGLCLLEVDGRNILLVIEVKSGFNEVKGKGFEQLVASYVKVRSILQSIEGYNPDEYEEIGLLVSYPPTGSFTMPATSIIGAKMAMISQSPLDGTNNTNIQTLKANGEVMLDLHAYNVNACHVNPALYNRTLHVKHVAVTDQVNSEVIDLDSYL